MKLFRSELLRARSRRFVKLAVLVTAGLIVLLLGLVAFTAHPPTDQELATARANYQREVAQCMRRDIDPSEMEGKSKEAFCDGAATPFSDVEAVVSLRDLDEVLRVLAQLMILLGIMLGATLAGADWGANTMTTLLTWEPRRLRVVFTRAVVVAITVVVVALILQAVFSAVFLLVCAVRGVTEFLPPNFWWNVATTGLRVGGVAAAFGLMSFAVAMVGRSTVAALAVLFGYLIAIEGVLAGFRPKIEPYLAIRAAVVIISRQPFETVSGVVLDTQRALTVLATYVVGLLVVAALLFRRRDVT